MLLQTIELKNFRQFVSEKIDFSTDLEQSLQLLSQKEATND